MPDEHPRPSTPEYPGSAGRDFAKRLPLALLDSKLEPTVIHRAPAKSRPGVILVERNAVENAEQAVSSPSTSGTSSNNSAKSFVPWNTGSTAKTSLDSKFSAASTAVQSISEHRPGSFGQKLAGSGSLEHPLASIKEVEVHKEPEPKPSKCLSWYEHHPDYISNQYSRKGCIGQDLFRVPLQLTGGCVAS